MSSIRPADSFSRGQLASFSCTAGLAKLIAEKRNKVASDTKQVRFLQFGVNCGSTLAGLTLAFLSLAEGVLRTVLRLFVWIGAKLLNLCHLPVVQKFYDRYFSFSIQAAGVGFGIGIKLFFLSWICSVPFTIPVFSKEDAKKRLKQEVKKAASDKKKISKTDEKKPSPVRKTPQQLSPPSPATNTQTTATPAAAFSPPMPVVVAPPATPSPAIPVVVAIEPLPVPSSRTPVLVVGVDSSSDALTQGSSNPRRISEIVLEPPLPDLSIVNPMDICKNNLVLDQNKSVSEFMAHLQQALPVIIEHSNNDDDVRTFIRKLNSEIHVQEIKVVLTAFEGAREFPKINDILIKIQGRKDARDLFDWVVNGILLKGRFGDKFPNIIAAILRKGNIATLSRNEKDLRHCLTDSIMKSKDYVDALEKAYQARPKYYNKDATKCQLDAGEYAIKNGLVSQSEQTLFNGSAVKMYDLLSKENHTLNGVSGSSLIGSLFALLDQRVV